jgi:hypothetical protein
MSTIINFKKMKKKHSTLETKKQKESTEIFGSPPDVRRMFLAARSR